VHPSGGSLRVFRQFTWLEAGSGKVALSRPAHPWVTHPVGELSILFFSHRVQFLKFISGMVKHQSMVTRARSVQIPIVVRIVSILSWILGSRPARGNPFSAKSKPSSTNLCRVCKTVNQLVCKSSATSKSGFPESTKSRMFTCLIFLAPGRPFWVSETNSAFSSLFKSTMYFFAFANSFLAFGEFYLSKPFR
jgi:hypothetical protein